MMNFEKLSIAIAIVLLIFGCASTLTEEEIFDNDQDRLLTLERYNTCKYYFVKYGAIWRDETGTANPRIYNNRTPPVWAMKQQLSMNHCWPLLRRLEMD